MMRAPRIFVLCLVAARASVSPAEGSDRAAFGTKPLPPAAVVRISTTPSERGRLTAHAAFSVDGRILAVRMPDNTLAIWNLAGSGKGFRLGMLAEDDSAAFSPGGRAVVAAMKDNTLRLWDATTGTQRLKLGIDEHELTSATFSPDGRVLAIVSRDGTIGLWDVATGRAVFKVAPSKRGNLPAAFSPDGSVLATVTGDGTLHVWDLEKGRGRFMVSRFRQGGFSPDGKVLMAMCGDNKLCVFDVPTGKRCMVRRNDEYGFTCAEFCSQGDALATMSRGDTLRLWDAATGSLRLKVEGIAHVSLAVSFLSRGRASVPWAASNVVLTWDLWLDRTTN